MPRNGPNDLVDAVIERCQRDPSLNMITELRKVVTKARGIALLDDMESRRDDLRRRFKEAYISHEQVRATQETGAAIASYHQKVVTPLLNSLLDELVAVQCELALLQSQLGAE